MSDSEEDYSDSGSGSDLDSSDSGSDSGSVSGSDSGSDSDVSGEGSDVSADSSDEEEADDEADKLAAKADVQMIVELCSSMDSNLNRIRAAFARPLAAGGGGGGEPEGSGGARTATTTPTGRGGEREEGRGTTREGNTTKPNDQTPRGQDVNPNTSRTPELGDGPGADDEENVDPKSEAEGAGSKLGSRQSSRAGLNNPDAWESESRYSQDSLARGLSGGDMFGAPNGINGHPDPSSQEVITGTDLYAYDQGGVNYGQRMTDDKRAQLIGDAIKALMEADDDD